MDNAINYKIENQKNAQLNMYKGILTVYQVDYKFKLLSFEYSTFDNLNYFPVIVYDCLWHTAIECKSYIE